MSHLLHTSLGRALVALAVTVSFATPAAADHWRGHPDCQGYPGYHQGMGDCPYAQGGNAPAAMSGKSLGVYISDLPNALLDSAEVGYGVNVERVQPDSAAAAAGIRAGDVITEFAGKPVLSGERLRWLVRKAESAKPLEVKLLREGKPVTLSVTLKEPEPKCEDKGAPRLGT